MLLGETDFVSNAEKYRCVVKVLILLVVNVEYCLKAHCRPRRPVARDLNRVQKCLLDPRYWSR